jgi:alkylhydroperoxidase family enzyme
VRRIAHRILQTQEIFLPFIKSLPDNASPLLIYGKYPEIYGPWSSMSEALMNGPSPFSQAERGLIFAYAAGAAGCEFVYVAHSEVAYARGIERGTLEDLLRDPEHARVDARMKPVLALVRKLAAAPTEVVQGDVDAVLAAGWDERAVHDAIATSARAAFMHRIAAGFGLVPLSREVAAEHAERRIRKGYVKVVGAFDQSGKP